MVLHFTYVTTHSPTLTSLYYVTAHSPTLPCFTYVTIHYPTLLSLLLRHKLLTQYTWRDAHGSFMLPVISATFSLFSVFFQEKQLSLTETIKYEINKYMFKFIIFIFFCVEIINLTESKSRRWTPLVTSAVLKPNYSSGTIRTYSNKRYPLAQLLEHSGAE